MRPVTAGEVAPSRWSGLRAGWRPDHRRALRDGLVAAGVLFLAYTFVVVAPSAQTVGFDAYSYWSFDIASPYAVPIGQLGAFPYSPVIARLFSPFSLLPWLAYLWLWLALLVGTVLWLGGRRWWLAAFAFPPVAIELYHGNIQLLIAAAIALGFRYPAAWAFVLLSKVTPGVGLIWFLVRREWRSLAIALGLTAVLVVVSLAVDAPIWREWIDNDLIVSLRTAPDQNQIAIPLLVRLPVAALIVAWGARTNRRWTVPLAAALAVPVLWFSSLAILAATPAVSRPELRERARSSATPAPSSEPAAA
jgi:hypothetical protein